jgi:hypothetical protein
MQFEQQPKQRGIDEARPTILATEGRDAAMVAKKEWLVSTAVVHGALLVDGPMTQPPPLTTRHSSKAPRRLSSSSYG